MSMREMPAEYSAPVRKRSKKYLEEEKIVNQALSILRTRLRKGGKESLTNPCAAINVVKLALAEEEKEVFGVLFLDTRHRLISFERLFTGTVDGASVYPREVVKRALKLNAAAVIFAHNHPSGVPKPSDADERITERLQAALTMVDVRVLDHVIVGGLSHASFAQMGLI
ncbi:hypothetical protein A9Q88_11955 [Gammaproteobacteria bacterium 50_400_T64]|nr:hypothetical protein A9Q88_11955 [Gammaproteobacteria bacterium 50_400_T64]